MKKNNQNITERECLITQQETDEERIVNLSLRPSKINDFVGQEGVIENLLVSVEAAKRRSEPVEHLLFSGPPGLGKTTLAHIIAHEMDAKITATSGPAIERAGDLVGILTNMEKGDVLFIDEIHRCSKVVEEFLYPAMENFQIDFIVDRGPYAKTIKFNLKPFTLVGATTRSGLLTAPLRARFGIFHHLEFYEPDILVRIIERSAELFDIKIDRDSAFSIAKRARGTPRIANRLLRRVRDYAQVKGQGEITIEIVNMALQAQGIDNAGLDNIDRKVLKMIIEHYKGGPVGIDTLAASLNEEVDTIVDVVEPYLLKIGFLKRTPRGREAGEAAYKHLGY
ncbi:MAG: Holliday junction branch migration DNA helicase RuvB [Candidatus Omnitrophota bacterium]